MKFPINKFKKISGDQDSTTLQHEDGHQIKVVHKFVSPKMREQMAALDKMHDNPKMMAEGGDVSSSASPEWYKDPNQIAVINAGVNSGLGSQDEIVRRPDLFAKSQEAMASHEDNQRQVDLQKQQEQIKAQEAQGLQIAERNKFRESHGLAPLPGAIEPPAPQPPAPQGMPQATPQPMPNQDPYGYGDYSKALLKGFGEQRAGIFGQANAAGLQAKEEQQALAKSQQQQQDLQSLYKGHFDQIQQRRDALTKDAMAGHVDPNHFWNDKSVPSKIATIAGLIIGGLGNSDMPIQFLKQNIERDVDAQKSNMANKFSLLNANRQDFENEKDATDMTRLMLSDQMNNSLRMAAAKATDPMAKARALEAAGKLDMQYAPLAQQIAMRKSLMNGTQQGQINPSMAIRFLVPEQQQKEAYSQLQDAQEAMSARDNALSTFDQIAKLNTVGNRSLNPIQSKAKLDALKKPLVAALSKATAGRFTETDSEFLDSLFKGVADNPQTVNLKRGQLLKLIQEKMHYPILDSYMINPAQGSRYNTQGQGVIQEGKPVFNAGK